MSARALSLPAVALLCILGAAVAASQHDEASLKAAFLYRFTSFVQWPEADPDTSFDLCVSGDDEVMAALEALTRGKQVKGRSLALRRLSSPSQARGCQLVYLGADTAGGPRGGAPGVLTVGDAPDFARRGGIIAFVRKGPRLRFEVNRAEGQRAGLSFDARLLDLAEAVHE